MGFSRIWTRFDAGATLNGTSCVRIDGSPYPDWQFRLFRPGAVRLIEDIHTPGFILERHVLAPEDACFYHFDWIVRNYAERRAKMEKYEAQRQVKNDAPLKGDRGAPPVGGETTAPKSYLEFLEQAGGGVVGGYNNFWLSGGDHVIRVDGQPRSSIIIDPPDGQVPAMKPEAAKRNQAFLAGAAAPDASESGNAGPPGAFDGPETRPLAERCLLGFLNTSGPPTLPNYFYNNLKQIVQTKDTVVILVEMVHDARVIRMNAEHLPPTVRKWMGDSVGHWEGDTLVVDTTNFTGKTQFRGSGENLHVVERFTRVDPKTILYRFTVDDPTTWDRSWTGEYPWNATDEHIYEYACHEGNYSLGGMLRGARQKEAEEKKQ